MSLDGPFETHSSGSADDLSARQNEDSETEAAPPIPLEEIPGAEVPALSAAEPGLEGDENAAAGLFRSWAESGYDPWPQASSFQRERIPNLGHLAIFSLIGVASLVIVSLLTRSALYFHFLGITSLQQAVTDIRYTLGAQAVLYLLTLLASVLLLPLIWHKSFLSGLQWNGIMAIRLRRRLLAAAFMCFLCALVNGWLLPGPDDTPIDKIFRTPGAAWLLFGFGVTFAPFFEEIMFRGFLLPSLCTALDWIGEKSTGRLPRRPFESGHPRWSVRSMTAASILTSIPFALMHAEQTGYAMGPFLLLVFVSMVLCWARLSTRSLAASVLVHSCYNLMLFSLMLLGTGGFRHLEKM
jgi:membrane protease YdiL (CAAX protease family)